MAADTEFSIDIAVTGQDTAEAAAAKVAALGEQLAAAKTAASQAAEALSSGEASYKAAESAADRAAKAVEKIGVQIDAQRGKMQSALEAGDSSSYARAAAAVDRLTQAQEAAQAKAGAAKAALAAEAAAVDKLKAASTQAAEAQKKVAAAEDEAKKKADALKKAHDGAGQSGTLNARAVAGGLGKLGGPLGETGQKIFGVIGGVQKLGKNLGAAGPYVIFAVAAAAVVAGVTAIGIAAAKATVEIAIWAVGLADAARTNEMLAAGMVDSVDGGIHLNNQLNELENRVPIARDELSKMAKDLAKTGLRGAQLGEALEAAAEKAAKAKFGPEWEREMLSIGNQTAKLQRSFKTLFSGLNIEKLLNSLSTLVDLFDQNEATGEAIKVVFESLFQPLIDGAVAFIPKARAAFIQFEILVLKALIAIKPWGSKILLVVEAFGVLAAILFGAIAAAIALVVVNIGLLAFAFSLVVAAVVAVGAAFVYLGTQLYGFYAAVSDAISGGVDFIVGKFNEVVAFLQGLSLTDIGTQMINGLVDGIKAGGAAVLAAITGIASGAIQGAKKALGIASPSKVFEAEIGMNIGGGIARGVDKTGDDVQGAIADATAPPTNGLDTLGGGAKAKDIGASSDGKGGGAAGQFVFNFYGVEGADDAQQRFTEALENFLAQAGGQVPA